MNKIHFKKVLDHITEHPETWDQSFWHCMTVHCFAGWAQLFAGINANGFTACHDAEVYLDISSREAAYLFACERTLADFQLYFDHGFYDDDGYGRDGYNRDGYDRDGYCRDGYNRDGYDRDGYDFNGYDRAGYYRDRYYRAGLDGNNRPKRKD